MTTPRYFLTAGSSVNGWTLREPIHQFTVDRHLMQTAVNAASLVRKVSRPDLLLLAAIFHDIGKGLDGDHSTLGADLVVSWLTRMGVEARDITLVSTLIRYHLLLGDTASRRDPDDPATVASIIDAVGDAPTLELLHALTEADAGAAGPAAWTAWKAGQIGHLVARARRALAGEPPAEPPKITQVERDLIDAGGVGIVIEQVPGALRVTIAAPDRPGLLAASAAVLTLHRLTVRTAGLRTVQGTALQTWTVAPQFGDPPAAGTLRADLIRALDGSLNATSRLARRPAPARRRPAAAPAQVLVIDGASEFSSVIEVRAHDTPGLLHTVASALTTLGVSVVSARVQTLGADAVDVFYLQTAAGAPPTPARATGIASAVRDALA